MRLASLAICLGLLAGKAGMAAPLGFVDGVSAAGAAGWACAPGVAGTVSVAAVAGDRLLAVAPALGNRPDVAGVCGTPLAGFSIAFDRATAASLAGEPSLTFFALAPGQPPAPLRGSNPAAALPFPLPAGALDGLGAGQVLGHVVGATPPRLLVTGGAPAADGGVAGGTGFMISAPGGWRFALPVPPVRPPPAATAPVFGYATDSTGAFAPMTGALIPGATIVPLAATIAQAGGVAGIRNSLATAWLPAGLGVAGVSGQVSLAGSAPGFSEALVILGATADPQGSCASKNGASVAGPPSMTRLWAGILKNTGAGGLSIPAAVALPYPFPPSSESGTCLIAWISAGYAYLTGNGFYTTTAPRLQIAAVPVAPGAPAVFGLGIGGEFRMTVGSLPPPAVYVGFEASRPIVVDGIAGAISAAPVVNAPAGTGWQPPPSGSWSVGTTWLFLPAAACAAAHLQTAGAGNGMFTILRQSVPQPMAMPAGGRDIMRVAEASWGGLSIQKSSYQAFTNTATGTASLMLNTGDCLVGWEQIVPMPGGTPGVLDVEDQSTVYLRVAG